MQTFQNLGRHRVRQLDHGGRPLVGTPGLAFLLVGEGRGAQREDLVDLGGVVERAGALRRDGRMVLQDDRRGQHEVGAAGFAGEYGPGVQVAAGGDRALRPLGGIGHRQERSGAEGHEEVGGHQGVRQRRLPVGAAALGRCPVAGVLDDGGQPHGPVGAVEFAGGQPDRPADLLAAPDQSADGTAGLVQDRHGVLAGGKPEGIRDAVAEEFVHRRDHLDALLASLVPGHQHPVVEAEFGHGVEAAVRTGPLHRAPSGVQEAHLDREGRTRLRFHQAFGVLEVVLLAFGAPAGRHEHPELPAQPVLGRRGTVGVEHVALEEDGVGHLPGAGEALLGLGGERGHGHGSVLPVVAVRARSGSCAGGSAPSSSAATVASQEGRACRER